eukprot:gene55529-74135_t
MTRGVYVAERENTVVHCQTPVRISRTGAHSLQCPLPPLKKISHLLHPNPPLACRPLSSEELLTFYNPRRISMHTSRPARSLAVLGAVSAAAAVLTACGSMSMTPAFNQSSLPPTIQVPAGHKVAMETVGKGDITYECRDKANAPGQTEWVFIGPDA